MPVPALGERGASKGPGWLASSGPVPGCWAKALSRLDGGARSVERVGALPPPPSPLPLLPPPPPLQPLHFSLAPPPLPAQRPPPRASARPAPPLADPARLAPAPPLLARARLPAPPPAPSASPLTRGSPTSLLLQPLRPEMPRDPALPPPPARHHTRTVTPTLGLSSSRSLPSSPVPRPPPQQFLPVPPPIPSLHAPPSPHPRRGCLWISLLSLSHTHFI